jgi:hypothetical protein
MHSGRIWIDDGQPKQRLCGEIGIDSLSGVQYGLIGGCLLKQLIGQEDGPFRTPPVQLHF